MKNKHGFMLGSVITMLMLIAFFISWQTIRLHQERKTFLHTEQFLQSLNNNITTANN